MESMTYVVNVTGPRASTNHVLEGVGFRARSHRKPPKYREGVGSKKS